jgi:hypothetical protein
MILPRFFQPFQCNDLIRLGKDNDGGYLVNKQDIFKSKSLLSFGIGEDWSFEQDFMSLNDCPLRAYDKSLDISNLSNKALSDLYHKFFTDDKYHIKKNIGLTIEDELVRSIITENSFLKCDIEGSEYDILEDLINHSSLLTGMVLEFHNIEHQYNLFSIIDFMCRIPHKLVHTHINNWWYFNTDNGSIPSVVELTFSSSYNVSLNNRISLPNILDMPNNPNGEEIQLIFN